MPSHTSPISEQYRIVALQWIDADAAARMMEECKTATLEQRKVELIKQEGSMPDNAAERTIKASPEWHEYLHEMVHHRTKANKLKCQLEYIRMQSVERAQQNRANLEEMKMTGRMGDGA